MSIFQEALRLRSWILAENCDVGALELWSQLERLSNDWNVSAVLFLNLVLQSTHYLHQIISNIIYPHDQKRGVPYLSPNGRYVVKLNFNGCFRRVVIDDRLPVSKTRRNMHIADRNNPSLLWPALLEKAYLKIRGGYDFPGSNSGTDLWVLIGWIPEQVYFS